MLKWFAGKRENTKFLRGCIFGGKFQVFKGRKSVIFGAWAARGPGRPFRWEGGLAPHLLEGFPGPRGRPDPQNGRLPILIKILIFISPQSAGRACRFDSFFIFLCGDLVSGPWGSIPGPGEGLLRGLWTPEKIKIVIFIRAQRAPTLTLAWRR